LITVVLYGFGEAGWLKTRRWSSWTKSLVFALLKNLLGFCFGFLVAFLTVGVTFALAWDGSMSNLPFQGNELVVVFLIVLLLLPTSLALVKRLAALVLRIGEGKSLWLFSFCSAIGFWLMPLLLTFALTKLLWPVFMRR
jgi:hypothetical protein